MPKFRVSLFSLALMLAVPFAPQAVAKTAAATTASQPEIASGSAMIVDLNTNKVIYSNHPDLVRPIASISKLMTAMVVLDARLPLDEKLKVDISQTPEMKATVLSMIFIMKICGMNHSILHSFGSLHSEWLTACACRQQEQLSSLFPL